MSKICPLFSGSTGNCTYIGTKNGAVLVDAGASMKRIITAIECAGGTAEEIKAIAVTHQHIDHITGLRPILNKLKIPLIASEKTIEALIKFNKIPQGAKLIAIEDTAEVDGIIINRFATSHDCEGSSGYSFILPDQKKFTLCTDLGIVTDEVRNALNGSDLVLLESNHDVEMLKRGPYPPELKIRIMSDKGHISNNVCSAELVKLLKNGTKRFILGHLSQNNNTPLVARSSAEAALMDIGAENGKDYLLYVAHPQGNGVTVI
ncbi:MAG: MBL fold metallo-hydrolase [Clostridia bacterium]|nr:MBL fold metallo-hydrolase [Clostridia bacterium]